MEVWKGQIKSPRGLITRIDMKNRSAKVLVEGGRPAATLLRTPLATNRTLMATPPGQEYTPKDAPSLLSMVDARIAFPFLS